MAILGYAVYTMLAEWKLGQTVGKRLAGLHVVRESGAPITLGQAVVRQLPLFLQIAWIDVLAVFFTDRRQRLFELLSKTRVVLTAPRDRDGADLTPQPARVRPDPTAGR